MDSLELFAGDARLEAQSDLRAGPGVSHVPAFGLPARQPDATGRRIIRMHLHGKFFVGKKKFQEQRKTVGIGRRIAHQFAAILHTQISQRFSS